MNTYYILTDSEEVIALDVVTDWTKEATSKITNFPVEDGSTTSDHYINDPIVVKFRGSVSDINGWLGGRSEKDSASNTIEKLESLKNSKRPFRIYVSNKLLPIDDCLLTSLKISQNKTKGRDGYVNAFEVDFEAKQVKFVTRAAIAVIPDNIILDEVSERSAYVLSPQTVPREEEERILTERDTIIAELNNRRASMNGL